MSELVKKWLRKLERLLMIRAHKYLLIQFNQNSQLLLFNKLNKLRKLSKKPKKIWLSYLKLKEEKSKKSLFSSRQIVILTIALKTKK